MTLALTAARMAVFTLLVVAASGAEAQTRDAPYRLPPPWIVDDGSSLDEPVGARRGLVVHAVKYSAGRPQWSTRELAARAERECGRRLMLPPGSLGAPDSEPEPDLVEREVWLVFSGIEALQLERYPILVGLRDCTAVLDYGFSKTRFVFSGELVTTFSFGVGDIPVIDSLPAADLRPYGFLPLADLAELRRRYGDTTYRPESSPYPDRVVCFYTGDSLDRSSQCHLDKPGPWRGLLLSRHGEHTATYYEGMRVEQYWLDAWIDGRLFEWQREITTGDVE